MPAGTIFDVRLVFLALTLITDVETIKCYFENANGYANGANECLMPADCFLTEENGQIRRGCTQAVTNESSPLMLSCTEDFCNGAPPILPPKLDVEHDLPFGWKHKTDINGSVVYVDGLLGTTTIDHPNNYPMPPRWKVVRDPRGNIHYSKGNKRVSFRRPEAKIVTETLGPLPKGWGIYADPSTTLQYFADHCNLTSQWDDPRSPTAPRVFQGHRIREWTSKPKWWPHVNLLISYSCITVGIAANVLVLISVFGDKEMRRSSMFLLLANLALADGSYLVVLLLRSVLNQALHDIISCGACMYPPLFTDLLRVSLGVACYTNVAVCLERYYSIVHPLRFRQIFRPRRTVVYASLIWLVALVTNVYCPVKMDSPRGKLLQALLIALGIAAVYLVPAATLAIFYTITCRTLWSGSQKLRESCPERTKGVVAARRSVVKMLIICVLTFYCCYIPWSVYQLFWWTYGILLEDWGIALRHLTNIACSANPFIYALYSETFRKRVESFLPEIKQLFLRTNLRRPKMVSLGIGVAGIAYSSVIITCCLLKIFPGLIAPFDAVHAAIIFLAHLCIFAAIRLHSPWVLNVFIVVHAVCVMISISSLLTYFFAISIMLISGSIQAVEDHAIKIALLIGYIAVGAWSFLVVGSTKELLEAEIQTITSSSSATASSTVPSNS